jgi:sugar phosphate isomerase/epimerase
MQSRRDLLRLTAATVVSAPFINLGHAAAPKVNSVVQGVMLGAQSYSFRDRSFDAMLEAMSQIGLGYCELFSGHIEPKDMKDKEAWRKSPPWDELAKFRKKFDEAGIQCYAVNISFRDSWSDLEIENGMKIARALGTDKITASSNVSTAARIDPFAKKHKVYVGMHNHSNLRPNEFAKPEDFEEAMKGKSKYIAVNLDIGHFTAANFDPVDYLTKNYKRIVTLHIKDRGRNQGANVEFGKGETKIKDVLQLMKAKKYKIPANIEYEYRGADTVAEVKKCFEYCKSVLA